MRALARRFAPLTEMVNKAVCVCRGAGAKPVWPWWSGISATEGTGDRCWQSLSRRCDFEHTPRLFKRTMGWTKPRTTTRRRPIGGLGW